MSFIKKTAAPVISALALVFAVGAASAEGPSKVQSSPGKRQVACYLKSDLESGVKEQFNMTARERGENEQFDLQLYANDEGRWLLAGEPKDHSMIPDVPPEVKLSCVLGNDVAGYPDLVQAAPWYKEYFMLAAPGQNV